MYNNNKYFHYTRRCIITIIISLIFVQENIYNQQTFQIYMKVYIMSYKKMYDDNIYSLLYKTVYNDDKYFLIHENV